MLRHLLRRRRWELGLTQVEVAVLGDLTPLTVGWSETGRTNNLRDETLRKFAFALEIPEEHLLAARAAAKRPRPRRISAPHGTVGGYTRHRWYDEEPCRECRDAYNDYQRDRYGNPRGPLQSCGTYGAYGRHLRDGEVPCEACMEARRIYERASRGYQPRKPPQRCGTEAAYVRHLRNEEVPCQPCRDAFNAYRRAARGYGKKSSQSGFTGVYRLPGEGGMWQATVRVKAGSWSRRFSDPTEAARARDAKAVELIGPGARLNFPREKAA